MTKKTRDRQYHDLQLNSVLHSPKKIARFLKHYSYIDSLSLSRTTCVIGKMQVLKSVVKMFLLKILFFLQFLAKNSVHTVGTFAVFNVLVSFDGIPPYPLTISSATKWFREQGFLIFYVQLLKALKVL